MIESVGKFRLDGMMRYSRFVPRLYNFCKSLGFEAGKILPSRAFCSDESQGYPVILLAKHFGTFPFNHGQVGGVVATDRHGPHAEHGKDMVIVQASHVGYDPDTALFGTYRRLQTEQNEKSPSCGKVHGVSQWYQEEYHFACDNIFVERLQGDLVLTIDNQLLREERDEGLFLHLERLIETGANGEHRPLMARSTSKTYTLSAELKEKVGGLRLEEGERHRLGRLLAAEHFHFKRQISGDTEGRSHLEANLLRMMPYVVCAPAPLLAAAQLNTQVEFDRTFRTIVKEHGYQGKKVVFIAGLNIDISPQGGQLFPLTKFVPWAAYIQDRDGSYYTLEQDELVEQLKAQTTDNPEQIDLERAIQIMGQAREVVIDTAHLQGI